MPAYAPEAPRRGASRQSLQSMFWSESRNSACKQDAAPARGSQTIVRRVLPTMFWLGALPYILP